MNWSSEIRPAWTFSGSKTKGLEDAANLLDPDVIALEIAEDLEAAREQFSQIATDPKG